MDYGRSDLADRLAMAYAAGTLRGGARRRFEALLPAHAALRDATQGWQERLMPLTAVLPPEAPPARVWQRIKGRIAGAGAAPVQLRTGFGSRLAFWRGLAGVASVAALSLAVLLASPAPVPPPIIVVLSSTGAAAGAVTPASFVASISGDGSALVTKPLVNVALRPDRALELWAIPRGGVPRSLGVISASGATVVRKGKVLEGAETLAVTVEPPGGSPTGAATGPVLYAGKLTL
ncbi:MAG: anti-sigma factor [Caldimonas sp.]